MCLLEYFEKHIRINIKCNNLYSKKIIQSDYYYLYNIKTVEKFNLKITCDYIVEVCKYNHTDLLTLLKNSDIPLEYNEKALDTASAIGHINILEWWKNSQLLFVHDESSLGYNIFKLVRRKKNNVNNVNVINCINWILHDDSLFPRFKEVYYGALLMYSIH